MPKSTEERKLASSPEHTQAELKQLLADEKEYVKAVPFDLIDSGYLHIKTKTGQLIPLQFNETQDILYDQIRQLRKEKKPVRIWVLKPRQTGVSTETEAVLYSLTSQQENRNSLIMADEVDKSDYLFEMTKLYQEKLEEHEGHLAPKLKKSNQKKLEFKDIHSQIIIETGQNVAAARAFTYQYVHLSEVAFFPKLRDVLDGLLQSVPDHWDSMVIGETTAHGMDNEFYTEWQQAKKGKTDWIALFIGWYMMLEYSRPLGSGGQLYPLTDFEYDTDGGQQDFIKEEELLQRKFNLTNEQLNWRRWAIKNNCGGKVRTFRQEYPADDDEAFLVSGTCVFDTIKLKAQKLNAAVKAVGTLQEDVTGKIVFLKQVGGKFRLLEDIGKNVEAVIGGDVAEGVAQAHCAACVLDRRTNNTIMGYDGDTEPLQFADDLALLGKYCNNALIAVENNNMGYATCAELQKIYTKVYREELPKPGEEPRPSKHIKVGWNTNTRTRPLMITALQEEIREDSTELRDPILIDQALSFVRKPDGKIEVQTGKLADYLFARMIAGKVRALYPFFSRGMLSKVREKSAKGSQRRYKRSRRSPGY